MGMNYYLLVKTKYTTWAPSQVGCFDDALEVRKLENGYTWNNKYYPTVEDLNKEYVRHIHIGKASCGWNFLLAIYPEINIKDLDDWKRMFYTKGNKIVDEVGVEISPKIMLSLITNRTALDFYENTDREEYEKRQLEIANSLNASLSQLSILDKPCATYNTYDDILKENGAIRGINGLWAHDPAAHKSIIPGGPGTTYDYIYNETFS